MMTERAARFLSAYNKIDRTLRNISNFKPNMSFMDVVRRSAAENFIVARYQDTLLDYARLRNAIVHTDNGNSAIAEPYEETVTEFERICELITSPPTAVDVFGGSVKCLDPKTSVKDAVLLMAKTGYSNLPVYDGERILGVAGNRTIVGQIAGYIREGTDLNEALASAPVLPSLDPAYYLIKSSKINLPELCELFYQNRRLLAVVITKKGTPNERPAAIVTNSDISRMENILTNYE